LIDAHHVLKIATLLYGLSLAADAVLGRRATQVVLMSALAANGAAAGMRYWMAWPMMPMYLGSAALPLCLGLLALFHGRDGDGPGPRRLILGITAVLALAAVLFPKDFYLPFVKSNTLLAHLFLLFGVAGKGCFLAGAARALARPSMAAAPAMAYPIWGFAFWTLSMFFGELWSYRGWGTPVVWDDAVIATTMATWFFYVGALHLHLTGTWTVRGRNGVIASGAAVVFLFNCLPDLGPFRWPL